MTVQGRAGVARLQWWALAIVAVALVVPLPSGWNGLLQLLGVGLAVVALCTARDHATRVVAAVLIIVVGTVICVQVTSHVAAAQFEGTFSDDATLVQ